MTQQFQTVLVRLSMAMSITLLCGVCNVGGAQSVDEVLDKCRASLESISSYEYSAISTSNRGEYCKLFFSGEEKAFRYDQKFELTNQGKITFVDLVPNEMNRSWLWYFHTRNFRLSFDGENYYGDRQRNEADKTVIAAIADAGVVEPFYWCFCWLKAPNRRSELLEESNWQGFANSCEGFVSKQQIEGLSCFVLKSRRVVDGGRYEVAFGEEVGYLPVRVRRLVGQEGRIVAEWIFTDFKHFNEGGATCHFPTTFFSSSVIGSTPISPTTKIKPGTLYINQPIDYNLIRLTYDSPGFSIMDGNGTKQEWFSNVEADSQAPTP